MANDTDTEDVESPDTSADMDVEGSPEAGFSTGNGSGMGMAQPAQPTVGPMAQQPTAGGGGGLAGNIQSLLQGGLGGGPNVGPMVQQRHGGLLTGLAGVLLDGLASGMAPDAETAARMPMIRQQQAMQQQQMQLQQQKLQEEMRLQPVRDKLMLMQAQMAFMQVNHAMAQMTTQNQLGINDFTKDYIQGAIKGNRAEPLMEGTLDAAKQYVREHVHDADGMQLYPVPKEVDDQGNVTKAQVVKILPEAWAPAVKKTIPYHDPVQDKDFPIQIDLPAGPQREQSVELGEQFKSQLAAIGEQTKAVAGPIKSPAEGLTRAYEAAKAAGKDPMQDRDVQDWQQLIQSGKSEGFDEKTFQEQKAIKGPGYTRMQYLRDKPTTVISAEHAAIAEKGEARKETEAANWVPGTSGQMKNKTDLAENIAHNSNEVAAILMRRPDIVGRWGGTKSRVQEMMGNKDPDIAQVGTAIHNIAIASQGIHGMRSPEEVERFETRLFNNFLQGQKATIAALLANARSVQTFIDDSRPDTYRTHSKNGGALRAMRAGGGIIPSPEVVTEEPKE